VGGPLHHCARWSHIASTHAPHRAHPQHPQHWAALSQTNTAPNLALRPWFAPHLESKNTGCVCMCVCVWGGGGPHCVHAGAVSRLAIAICHFQGCIGSVGQQVCRLGNHVRLVQAGVVPVIPCQSLQSWIILGHLAFNPGRGVDTTTVQAGW
jgi:hypothetical protein